jgi:hypothetical protein
MLFERIQLEPGEEVLKVVRKHWFIIVAELFGTVMMALFPFFLLVAFTFIPDTWLPANFNSLLVTELITWSIAGWLVITLMTSYAIWTHYYLDLWVITDRRIIVVDQIAFFNRKVSSFRLERMQDIKVSINGILATFLNFGTLRAQTASSAESNFKSTGLPDPRGLQSLIQGAMDRRLQTLGNPTIAVD